MPAAPSVEALDVDGYAVVPAVLRTDEVALAREQLRSAMAQGAIVKGGGQVLPNAAAEAPDLAWLFAHPGIIDQVKAALQSEALTFTMEADLHWNYMAGAWHKDTGEQVVEGGYFGRRAVGRADCRVLKVALYLQDELQGAGLTVRPGSHHLDSLSEGAELPVRTRAGDMVIFDVRISHRGVQPSGTDLMLGRLARLSPPARRDHALLALRAIKRRVAGTPDRYAVFFAFGLPNEMTRVFSTRNMSRQLAQLDRRDPGIGAALRDAFIAANVNLVPVG